jgi:hypothetical protein
MSKPKFRFANLDDASLQRVKELEQGMGEGVCVLALEPRVDLAELDDEQVKRVHALEEELGVVLMAYKG